MKRLMIAVALPLLNTAMASYASATSLQAPDSVTLLRLEEEWNEAHLRGDAEVLERLWAADFEAIVPEMAPMSRSSALAFARSGRMRFDRYETADLRIRIYADVATVTGRLKRTRTMSGQTLEDDWHYLKVYTRRDGSWQVASFLATQAPR